MKVQDPFGFVKAINFPKDKKTVEKVHKVLFKTKLKKSPSYRKIREHNEEEYKMFSHDQNRLWNEEI